MDIKAGYGEFGADYEPILRASRGRDHTILPVGLALAHVRCKVDHVAALAQTTPAPLPISLSRPGHQRFSIFPLVRWIFLDSDRMARLVDPKPSSTQHSFRSIPTIYSPSLYLQ